MLENSEKESRRTIKKLRAEMSAVTELSDQMRRTLGVMNARTREHMHLVSVAECLLGTLRNVSLQRLRGRLSGQENHAYCCQRKHCMCIFLYYRDFLYKYHHGHPSNAKKIDPS